MARPPAHPSLCQTRVICRATDGSDFRHIFSQHNRRRSESGQTSSLERWQAMSIGSTDTVKSAPPPPRDPGAASPKQVKEFNEAVDRSNTSNNSSQPSQGASTSAPIMLARRPPIPAQTPPQTFTCATPTAQQKAGAFVDPALRDVAAGKKELAKNAKGTEVGKMQEALQTAGYKLPKYGADGKFGDETVKALKKFQTDHCLKDTGRLDKQTMEQLSIASTKFPEYGKLFADGKLNTTIGVGFDEGGWDKGQTKDIIAGLSKRGYTQLDPNTAASDKAMAERFKAAGIDPAAAKADGLQYFTKTFKHNGKDVTSVVKLITADTPQAKDKFAKAMGESEMLIYAGHGRYGSGPDFDDIKSPNGNFVIGKPYEAGHVTLNRGKTDLQKTAMTKDYQLMMFSGCTTSRYLDDLRAVPGKDSKNLDLVVSNELLYWPNMEPNAFQMLDGVTSGASINQIKAGLEDINKEEGKGPMWKADGFNDN
ncbi:peptidoglycan-binding domain-containing protein [Bradyrhizobium roseum]|uniref:peptidoglycan-binding domain-containing protein n=1 Tax=Bradyrhizobium roseum TaxID=3056648 RepID=UPI002629950E|nr:peptidoglycan-binding protein [Bradyrhizobium roseus]WKA30044.1 peptidoglycan-binding domain-containing protein [Bradyrhizobium roseus]